MRPMYFATRVVSVFTTLAVTACGGGGGGSTPPPVPPAKVTYSIGGVVSGLQAGQSVILANGSDTLTVSSNSTFTFGTKVDQNGSYSVTVQTQPGAQSCSVTSGSGSGVSANITAVTVTCTNRPQYAYVVNNGSDSVSQYSIDTSGMLIPLSVPTVATGHSPQAVTVDRTRKYVYVPSLTDNAVSQYVIQSDGSLAPNTPATVAAGRGSWAVAASPTGNWIYVLNSVDDNIMQFSVDSSGALAPVSTPAVSTGVEPWHLTITPDGKHAYVADHGNSPGTGQTVHQYAVDPGTGVLTPLNPASVPAPFPSPGGVAVDPTSSYVYLSNITGKSVSEFSIGTDGTLTSLNPSSVPAGTEPVFLAFDPTGKYAYVADYTVDYVSPPGFVYQYTVGTGGQLAPMATKSVMAGNGPSWVAFDPFGKYAYVTNIGDGMQPGTVSEYAIGSDGGLTLIGTVTAGLNAYMIATVY